MVRTAMLLLVAFSILGEVSLDLMDLVQDTHTLAELDTGEFDGEEKPELNKDKLQSNLAHQMIADLKIYQPVLAKAKYSYALHQAPHLEQVAPPPEA